MTKLFSAFFSSLHYLPLSIEKLLKAIYNVASVAEIASQDYLDTTIEENAKARKLAQNPNP